MSHPALTQLRALRYFKEIPALDSRLLDWLLLEDSMTKRFEQEGKRVSVTLLREALLVHMKWLKRWRCYRSNLATGYVKFCYVQTANPGLPGVPSCLNQRCAALSWPYKIWEKRR